jgi:hypothetical protein
VLVALQEQMDLLEILEILDKEDLLPQLLGLDK